MKLALLFNLAIGVMLLTGCSSSSGNLPTIPDPTVEAARTPEPNLDGVDLASMPNISKGRIQDDNTSDGSPNHIAKDLVANGKASIPFLIGKLDDEKRMTDPAIDYWGEMFVGDMALSTLFDLFTDKSDQPTIPGFTWDEFLRRGDDRTITGERVLRRYIAEHGREKIKQRWSEMWEKNKDRIFWDAQCYCFNLAK